MGVYCYNRPLIILAFSFFLTDCLHAQKSNQVPQHYDRYQLDLPAEWLKRPRLVRIITDILPQALTELKDRDFCTECKAGFKVTLYIDSVTVTNEHTSAPIQIGRSSRYTYSFNYSFYAALLLMDSSGNPLTMLRLNDAKELLHYAKDFSLTQNAVYRYEPVYDTLGRVINRRLVEEVPPVITDIPNYDAASVLTDTFLKEICERRILEIDKFLRKFN